MSDSSPPIYPPHWEADIVAADGGTMHLRPILASDADALVAFHGRLSTRTRYLRFFAAYPRIPEADLIRFTNVDHHDRVGLIALLDNEIIAVGRYERSPGTDEAEVAFVVADAHQGRGIGSVLLEHLAAAARECGIATFTAVVLAENGAMLRVFRDAGYQPVRTLAYGEVNLTFAVDATALTESVMHEREQHAEARSIRRLLFPSSVAVVGASQDDAKIGHALFAALHGGGFTGRLYPVNPSADTVDHVRAYARLADIDSPVDLAVVAVPVAAVPAVVEDCAAQHVHGLVIVTGGYGERGDGAARAEGLAAQRDLVAHAHAHGMRVVGPNCLGVINTDPSVRLNASLAPVTPPRGRAGFFCQSGALGVAVLGEAARRGLGVSTFVSAGNRADVSGNDLLQFWETDDGTDVALLYLESFGNPRKFARLARRMGRRKPIVAVKSGGAGVVAGLEFTSVEVPDASVDALFEASGVIRVDTLGDLFDVALLLTSQPLPAGDRVAVVGNSTALGMLVANACAAEGLALVRLDDVGVDATPSAFGAAVGTALGDDDVDAVVAVFVPPLQRTSGEEYAHALRAVSTGSGKAVLSTFFGFEGVPAGLAEPGEYAPTRGSVPSYSTPERAVRALARTVRHARWRARPIGHVPDLSSVDPEPAKEIVAAVLRQTSTGGELTEPEAHAVLASFGVAVVEGVAVHGVTEAQRIAREFDGPIALKSAGAARVHLADDAALADAWQSLGLAEDGTATVQRMAPRGVDVVLDVRDDHSFGALVSFGVGGVATDLLGDRAYAAVPLTDVDADQLVRAPRAAPLLTGYNGAEPADLAALSDLALRLSALADECAEIASCCLTAVAGPTGTYVLSASVTVARPFARADTGPRRLRGL